MNKLTVLYNLAKHMKENDAFAGSAAMEAKLDETMVGTATADFSCKPGHCEKKMELRFGEEVLRLEHQGAEKCLPSMCGPHGHHGHGRSCCGPQGKLERIMFLLKVLDKTELQELENGTKILTLKLASVDLPDCIGEHMRNKCCGTENAECLCDHHEKLRGWMDSCGCMALDFTTLKPESFHMTLTLNSDCSPAEMDTLISGSASDKDGKAHTLTLKAGCKHQ